MSELGIKNSLIVGFCAFFVFLSSLLVNLIQLINYLTIRYVNVNLYRQINSYFQYIIYSQIIAICEVWSGSTVEIYFADKSTADGFGSEHSLVVANHRYETDAAFLWLVAERYGCLGSSKAFAKRELRYVPIIGWTFFFGEYIFLERDWRKDADNIATGLDHIMAHKQPTLLMIAAEGTRFTAQKYETSMKFATDRGLGVHYKHHLLPRVKGFAYSVRHLKEKYPEAALYSLQLAFDENKESIKISNLIKGVPMNGSVHIKRIPLSTVPTDSEESIAKYLYDLYSEKDQLMEYYYENKKFPGIHVPNKRSQLPFLILWTNIFLTGIPFIYLMIKVFISGNLTLILITSLFIISAFIGLYFAIRSAKIDKSSSTYGTLRGNKSQLSVNGKSHKTIKVNNKFTESTKEE